jgi:hypothetical protein
MSKSNSARQDVHGSKLRVLKSDEGEWFIPYTILVARKPVKGVYGKLIFFAPSKTKVDAKDHVKEILANEHFKDMDVKIDSTGVWRNICPNEDDNELEQVDIVDIDNKLLDEEKQSKDMKTVEEHAAQRARKEAVEEFESATEDKSSVEHYMQIKLRSKYLTGLKEQYDNRLKDIQSKLQEIDEKTLQANELTRVLDEQYPEHQANWEVKLKEIEAKI